MNLDQEALKAVFTSIANNMPDDTDKSTVLHLLRDFPDLKRLIQQINTGQVTWLGSEDVLSKIDVQELRLKLAALARCAQTSPALDNAFRNMRAIPVRLVNGQVEFL